MPYLAIENLDREQRQNLTPVERLVLGHSSISALKMALQQQAVDPRQLRTALLFAVQLGRIRVVEFFLNLGVSLSSPDLLPLELAAKYNHPNLVKYLIQVGSPLYNIENKVCTALSAACAEGSVRSVRLLLQAGADPNARRAEALFFAVREKHPHIILILLSSGADWHNLSSNSLRELVKMLPLPEMQRYIWAHLVERELEIEEIPRVQCYY